MTSDNTRKNGVREYLEDILYGRRRSVVLEAILSLLSLAYCAAVTLRAVLFQRGILHSSGLPVRVISIGNITLGGTGKTPMVIAVAGLFAAHGRHPVVVSRGYGRKDESSRTVVSDGRTLCADTSLGGDEPVLIASSLAGVPVVAGADRRSAAQFAAEQFHADVVVLDDGFQHLRLRRDKDIVLIDATNPFGNGRVFPAGILREPLSALKRAHAVVITRTEAVASVDAIRERIKCFTKAPVFTSCARPLGLLKDAAGALIPLSVLKGVRVSAFSGIASPEQFVRMLEQLGAEIVVQQSFPDHYAYSSADLEDLQRSAAERGAQMIVTTEKDAVRLRGMNTEGVHALKIEFVVNEQRAWDAFLLEDA